MQPLNPAELKSADGDVEKPGQIDKCYSISAHLQLFEPHLKAYVARIATIHMSCLGQVFIFFQILLEKVEILVKLPVSFLVQKKRKLRAQMTWQIQPGLTNTLVVRLPNFLCGQCKQHLIPLHKLQYVPNRNVVRRISGRGVNIARPSILL